MSSWLAAPALWLPSPVTRDVAAPNAKSTLIDLQGLSLLQTHLSRLQEGSCYPGIGLNHFSF